MAEAFSSDLIPTFLTCFEALQTAANQSKQEKQESNRKKRAAQQLAVQRQSIIDKLRDKVRQPEPDSEEEDGEIKDPNSTIAKWEVRNKQRNKGVTSFFEQHVRTALATGATARQVKDMLLLDGNFLLPANGAKTFCDSLPQPRWFQTQREALGLESYLYSFMRIAGASRVIQWGFDETTLDGVSVLNQWAMLEFPVEGSGGGVGQSGVTIVTLECAGVLPCVLHVDKSWARGQSSIEALRAELSPEDEICSVP